VRSEAIVSIPQLWSRFAGRVIGPEDPEYDAARTVFPGRLRQAACGDHPAGRSEEAKW
jgi:hypothetical protein